MATTESTSGITPGTEQLWDKRVRRMAQRLGLHAVKGGRQDNLLINAKHGRSHLSHAGRWYISDPREDELPMLGNATTEEVRRWLLDLYMDRAAAGVTLQHNPLALVRSLLQVMREQAGE
jgi:hypothetical protein